MRRFRRLPALALLLAAVSCIGDRERLVPPRIVLELLDSTAAPGGSVRVRLVAFDDYSELLSIAVRARTTDSVFVDSENLFGGVDSLDVEFALHVASTAQEGEAIEVTASAINEQLLSRDTTAQATVRVPPP
jgi:hypothetical protein